MVSLAINIGEIIFQGKKVQETQAIQMKKVKSHLIVKSRTPRNLLESRNQLKIQTFKITMAHLTQISLKLKLRKAMNTVLNKMYLNPMCLTLSVSHQTAREKMSPTILVLVLQLQETGSHFIWKRMVMCRLK